MVEALQRCEAAAKKAIKDAEEALDGKALAKYPTLSKDEVKTLVVDDNWLAGIAATIHGEMDRISQTLNPARESVGGPLRDSTAPRRESGC